MKKQYFINANIIDPHNSINENGGMIIAEDGSIEAIGKKVNTNNIPSREKIIDLKGKYIFPGLVDMRVFAGEPGYEYKENFRTLSNAALAGGVTSVVTMPNTDPIIDNVSIVDFLKRRGRDKSKINIFPCASLTKNIEGTNISVRNFAIGKEDGERQMYYGLNNCGEASLYEGKEQRKEGEMVKVMSAKHLPRCDIMKIDTEGAEIEILEDYYVGKLPIVIPLIDYDKANNRPVWLQTEIAKKKAEKGEEITDELALGVISSYVKKMTKAVEEYQSLGERGEEMANQIQLEIDFLSDWLPEQLSEKDVAKLVDEVLADLGEVDISQMGRIIGAVMAKGDGIDGSIVSKLVREKIS